jgi:hypothetical protein
MTPRHSFDDLLIEWLDDGPTSAPRDDLVAVLEALPAVRQRSGVEREMRAMPTFVRLAVAAALVVLVAGVAALQLPRTEPPAAMPSATPGWAQRFVAATATTFRYPFRYALDPVSELSLIGEPDANVHQFGVCDPTTGGCRMTRVVIKTGTPLRRDVCSDTGGQLLSGYTPREFVDYMQALPGFRVTERASTLVDGRTALVADVDQLPRSARPCEDIWVWTDNVVSFTDGDHNLGWTRRFLAFEVDGRTVLVMILAEAAQMDAWLPTAMGFVDSIHFLSGDATPSPSR